MLIYEYMLGEDSRWKAYFDILPEHFDTLMFWSDEELKDLQSSAVVDKIGKSAADKLFDTVLIPIIRRHESIFKTSAEMSDQQLKDLAHRLGSIIMSYAFDIEKDDDEEETDEDGYATDDEEQISKGMVPLADLLNADAEPNVRPPQLSLTSRTLTFPPGKSFPKHRRTNHEITRAYPSRHRNPERLRPTSSLRSPASIRLHHIALHHIRLCRGVAPVAEQAHGARRTK